MNRDRLDAIEEFRVIHLVLCHRNSIIFSLVLLLELMRNDFLFLRRNFSCAKQQPSIDSDSIARIVRNVDYMHIFYWTDNRHDVCFVCAVCVCAVFSFHVSDI